MAVTFIDDASIAVGHGNAGGLVKVTVLTADSQTFSRPFIASGDTLGVRRPAPGGGIFRDGLPTENWVSQVTQEQHAYLYATYINVATRGAVTIRTINMNTVSYANFNAWLSIPDRAELTANYMRFISGDLVGMGWNNYVWSFTRLEAL